MSQQKRRLFQSSIKKGIITTTKFSGLETPHGLVKGRGYFLFIQDYLQKKIFLGLSFVSVTNGPFIDGRTTGIEPVCGRFTIHCLDPLGYIHPDPHTSLSLYLRSNPFLNPYDRYQREAFSYTIVASLLLCFGIRGRKASTTRSFLEKLQTKRLGSSLH
ncbi:hypothetical protein GQ457_07G008400 [Hibiscus cannabinus]